MVCPHFFSSCVYLKVRFITCTILLCTCNTSSPSQLPKTILKLCPASNKTTFYSTLCKALESFWKCSLPSAGSRVVLAGPVLPTVRHPTSRRLPLPPSAAGASSPSGGSGRAAQGKERGTSAEREAGGCSHRRGAERGTSPRHLSLPRSTIRDPSSAESLLLFQRLRQLCLAYCLFLLLPFK